MKHLKKSFHNFELTVFSNGKRFENFVRGPNIIQTSVWGSIPMQKKLESGGDVAQFYIMGVMSVCLPVKTSFWDRQLTYLVWNIISSLIAHI